MWAPYAGVELPGGSLLMGGYGGGPAGDGMNAACRIGRRGETWTLRGWIGTYGWLGKLPLDEPFMSCSRRAAVRDDRRNGTFYTALPTAPDVDAAKVSFHGMACAGGTCYRPARC